MMSFVPSLALSQLWLKLKAHHVNQAFGNRLRGKWTKHEHKTTGSILSTNSFFWCDLRQLSSALQLWPTFTQNVATKFLKIRQTCGLCGPCTIIILKFNVQRTSVATNGPLVQRVKSYIYNIKCKDLSLHKSIIEVNFSTFLIIN